MAYFCQTFWILFLMYCSPIITGSNSSQTIPQHHKKRKPTVLFYHAGVADSHLRSGVRTLHGLGPSNPLGLQLFLFSRDIYGIWHINPLLTRSLYMAAQAMQANMDKAHHFPELMICPTYVRGFLGFRTDYLQGLYQNKQHKKRRNVDKCPCSLF
jgi:hypothetical protein